MKKLLPLAAFVITFLTACDDTTGTAGTEVMQDGDHITTSTAIFNAPSKSILAEHVLIATSHSYLGCIVDPETGSMTRSSFLAQYRPLDNYSQPEIDLMEKDENGLVACDSCELNLYYTSYLGDSLVAMNARVRELDPLHIMEEGQFYYSDLQPEDYLGTTPRLDVSSTYSIFDPSRPNQTASSSAYYRRITMRLPVEYGVEIIRKYYTNPTGFTNAYQFIHQICPGLYVENTGGVGCMLDVQFSTLDVYFTYHGTTTAGNDTTYAGLARFSATEEVLQNTTVDTQIPEGLLAESNPYTMLKSPAGIYTELTLPVEEIFSGEHAKDTLNSAQLLLDQYNSTEVTSGTFTLPPPTRILLIPKSEIQTFFEKSKLPDDVTSFLATYSNGAYAFNNIARLIKTLYLRRDNGDSEWNKVVLIPVDADYTTVQSLYTSTEVLTRIRCALSMTSIRLVGGSSTPPQIRCIYSHFE